MQSLALVPTTIDNSESQTKKKQKF